MPAVDLPEFKAKTALRMYVAYGSEGVRAIDLFAAGKYAGPCCQLISSAFFEAADRGTQFGTSAQAGSRSAQLALAGLPMEAVGRMTATLAGAQPIAKPRQLALTSIAQEGDQSQFAGTGPHLSQRFTTATSLPSFRLRSTKTNSSRLFT